MTSIQLTIQLDSDAFADHTGTELARILTAYADRIRYDAHTGYDLPTGEGIGKDVNGHRCLDVFIREFDAEGDDAGSQQHPADCRYCAAGSSEGHTYRPGIDPEA